MSAELIPSLLEENLSQLSKRLKAIREITDWVHLDVCDGLFVPATTVAIEDLRALAYPANVELHLMVNNPQQMVADIGFMRAKRIVFHPGTADSDTQVIRTIQQAGAKAGLALEYMTDTKSVEDALFAADFIVVMPIHAGRQGQQFHPEALELIQKIRVLVPNTPIEVDGAMNPETIPAVIGSGASIINVGSYLWSAPELEDRWRECQAVISELRTKN